MMLSFVHFHRDFILQFGTPDVKTVIGTMTSNDTSLRQTTTEGSSRLGAVVHSLTYDIIFHRKMPTLWTQNQGTYMYSHALVQSQQSL